MFVVRRMRSFDLSRLDNPTNTSAKNKVTTLYAARVVGRGGTGLSFLDPRVIIEWPVFTDLPE